jgi:peptidoglycan biosynthesis protein MviN/MurJ (putative lipid II flippase)
MARLMAPVGLFTIICGYLSARLQSREHFSFSITEAIPAAVIALFVLSPFAMSSTTRLAAGTLIGFLLQLVVLLAMVQGESSMVGTAAIRLAHRSGEWRSLYRSVLVMLAAQAMLGFTIPLDQAFAARLGPGAIATLGYANRLVFLATNFGAVVLARALLPVLSGAVVKGDLRLGAHQARQWAFLLLGLGAVGALGIWMVSDWAVALVFERGAFGAEDSAKVASALRMGALQLPFYFGGLALVQWLAALGRYSALLVIAALGLATKLVLNILLVPGFGLEGIMLASAAMYALSFLCQMRAAQIS